MINILPAEFNIMKNIRKPAHIWFDAVICDAWEELEFKIVLPSAKRKLVICIDQGVFINILLLNKWFHHGSSSAFPQRHQYEIGVRIL